MTETATSQVPSESAGTPGAILNIASRIVSVAAAAPERPAIVIAAQGRSPRDRKSSTLTFGELEDRTSRYAHALVASGIQRGMRVLLMVKPGSDFIALVYALFKTGAVPILIDPGMGVSPMLNCIRRTEPQALVGIPAAHVVRLLRPRSFASVKHAVTVGRRWGWKGSTLAGLVRKTDSHGDAFAPEPTRADETAAILFTSGSTGPAKGVVYEHGMLDAQVDAIQTCYGIESGEVDVPAFAPFALFSVAMGMTCVIPDMDPTRPAHVDPAKIVQAIQEHQATTTFGSPAVWKRVGAYCLDRGIQLPTLRRVLVAGAPVRAEVIDNMRRVLGPDADVHTPYGATECLPVSSIAGADVQAVRQGRQVRGGTCVGRPIARVDVRIIRITDEPIPIWSDDLLVPDGHTGEIAVCGPVVTKAYFRLPEATAASKIHDGDRLWHRIGDVGYRDEQGRLWMCGRKAHRVVTTEGTLFSVPCESIFNAHADVFRSALVGVGSRGEQKPIIIVEPQPGRFPRGARSRILRDELIELGQANEITRSIDKVLFHRSFPVDIRHNIKINREKLADWAAGRIR